MNQNKELMMSYFAGIMDGDGSFSLCKKVDKANRSPIYYPLIQLSSTNYHLIGMLEDTFGGSATTRKSHIAKDGLSRKESKRWKLEKRNQCQPFLSEIVPYLIVKKERGQFLIDYISENPFVRGSNKIDGEILIKRDKAYFKMHEFNIDKGDIHFKFPKKRELSSDYIFWSYLAGLMDTDGSFSIKREKTGRYSPAVLLTMIDHRAFELIFKNCPWGNISHVKAATSRNGYCYRMGLYSVSECSEFIKRITPFLRLKQKQANLVMDYCNARLNTKMNAEDHESWYEKVINANNGVYKSLLMDLKPRPGSAEGNKAQAGSNPCSVNAVSEETSKDDAVL